MSTDKTLDDKLIHITHHQLGLTKLAFLYIQDAQCINQLIIIDFITCTKLIISWTTKGVLAPTPSKNQKTCYSFYCHKIQGSKGIRQWPMN